MLQQVRKLLNENWKNYFDDIELLIKQELNPFEIFYYASLFIWFL